jgi:hypothetical protein
MRYTFCTYAYIRQIPRPRPESSLDSLTLEEEHPPRNSYSAIDAHRHRPSSLPPVRRGAYNSETTTHDADVTPTPRFTLTNAVTPSDVSLLTREDAAAADVKVFLPRPTLILCYVMIALVNILCIALVYLHSFNMTWEAIMAWITAFSFSVGLQFLAIQPLFALVVSFIRVLRILSKASI